MRYEGAIKILVLLSSFVMLTNSYCPGPGANPSFVQGPKVKQVSLTSVLLTWEGLVKQGECADQFLVKWWSRNDPASYELSDLLPTSFGSYQVNGLAPHRSYAFQVIAREDRGWLGADWNKSPIVYFTTTRPNPTVASPVKPKDVKHPNREANDELYDEYSVLKTTVATAVTPKDVKHPKVDDREPNDELYNEYSGLNTTVAPPVTPKDVKYPREMEMLDDISAEISLMRTNMDQISSMKSDMDEIKDKLDNLIHQFEEMRDTHFLPRTSQNP